MLLALINAGICLGQEEQEKVWSIEAGIGSGEMLENRSFVKGGYNLSEDEVNDFHVTADYWLSRHLAITGGLTFEQQGLFTDLSNGIGLKKVNMLGVNAGAKYYFFPHKWIVQPFVGASLYTNILNLRHYRGNALVTAEQFHPGCHGKMEYDVSCPAISLAPRIGLDLRLFSSVSLCWAFDLRFGLGGRNKGTVQFVDGPVAGQTAAIDEQNSRKFVSFGLKVDFPVKPVSNDFGTNLFLFLFDLFSSNNR